MLQYYYVIVINGTIYSWRLTNFNVPISTSFYSLIVLLIFLKTNHTYLKGLYLAQTKYAEEQQSRVPRRESDCFGGYSHEGSRGQTGSEPEFKGVNGFAVLPYAILNITSVSNEAKRIRELSSTSGRI